MSAFSDWKSGAITEAEYKHICWAEDMNDKHPAPDQDDNQDDENEEEAFFEEDDIDEF